MVFAHAFCAMAQKQENIDRPPTNPELILLKQWWNLDRQGHPITDEQVDGFIEYLKKHPILQFNDRTMVDGVATLKISTALTLYERSKEEAQKKKLLNALMDLFPELQKARDALGIDPGDPKERHLYFEPTPPEPKKVYKDLGEEMIDGQRKMNERISRKNKLHIQIDNLVFIHGYLHRKITDRLKIPLPNIPLDLERSPEEKARTDAELEKKAKALGRKARESAAPANGE